MANIIEMSVKPEETCRFCLKVPKGKFEIDEVMRQTFEILLLKLDLDITRDPIICQECMSVAKKCLNFKYTFINTEAVILSYCANRREIKHDIKVIYEERKHVRTALDEDFNVCRFCMGRWERNNFASLDALINESIFIMLSEYMVEMDFKTIENPLVCPSCKENVDAYFKFVLKCLAIEETIKEYCKKKGTDNMGQVKLRHLRLFMFIDMLEYPDKSSQRCKIEQKHTEGVISEIKMYKCSLCTYKSKQKCYLKTHMLVHKDVSEIEMYKCSLCTYESKYKQSTNRHMLVHKDLSEIEMYKCSLCTYETKQKTWLRRHMLVHKDVSEIKMSKCPLCMFETKRKRNLQRHMLVHKGVSEIKMYKCSLCTYEARHKSHLTRHMFIHKDVSEIEMYKCSLCTYEAKHKHGLTTHMLVHKDVSEIKMHKCSLCDFETKRKSYLGTHMLVHEDASKIKMYKCSLCTYEVKQKRSLTKHMLVHKDI